MLYYNDNQCYNAVYMKRSKTGYTMKQHAYARNLLSGKKESKTEVALSVGYAPATARNAGFEIEKTEGFSNAMSALAGESGNLYLQIVHTLKHKDLSKESTDTLLNAITTMANAWSIFTPKQKNNDSDSDSVSKLRNVLLQHVEHQTIAVKPDAKPINPIDE